MPRVVQGLVSRANMRARWPGAHRYCLSANSVRPVYRPEDFGDEDSLAGFGEDGGVCLLDVLMPAVVVLCGGLVFDGGGVFHGGLLSKKSFSPRKPHAAADMGERGI